MPKIRTRTTKSAPRSSTAKKTSVTSFHTTPVPGLRTAHPRCTCGHYSREHANYGKGACTDPHCQCAVFSQKPKRRKTDKPSSRARVSLTGSQYLKSAVKRINEKMGDILKDPKTAALAIQYALGPIRYTDSEELKRAKHNGFIRDQFARDVLRGLLCTPTEVSAGNMSVKGPRILQDNAFPTVEERKAYNDYLANIAYEIADSMMARRMIGVRA